MSLREIFSQVELERAEYDAAKLAEIMKDPNLVEKVTKFGGDLERTLQSEGHIGTTFQYPILRLRTKNGVAMDMNLEGTDKQVTLRRIEQALAAVPAKRDHIL